MNAGATHPGGSLTSTESAFAASPPRPAPLLICFHSARTPAVSWLRLGPSGGSGPSVRPLPAPAGLGAEPQGPGVRRGGRTHLPGPPIPAAWPRDPGSRGRAQPPAPRLSVPHSRSETQCSVTVMMMVTHETCWPWGALSRGHSHNGPRGQACLEAGFQGCQWGRLLTVSRGLQPCLWTTWSLVPQTWTSGPWSLVTETTPQMALQ